MKKIAIGDRRFVITKNLIMMLVMLVVIFVAIFAWFTQNRSVSAGGMSVSAKSADYVELALPQKVTANNETFEAFPVNNDLWTTNLEFKQSGYLKDFVKDITSNGEQFVIPNFQVGNYETGRTVIADDVWEEGLSSKEALDNNLPNDDDQYNYISFEFYARSKVNSISVLGDSFLAAASEKDNTPLKGTSVIRKSSYGPASDNAEAFSADAIVGAMRVSLVGAAVDGIKNSSIDSNYKVDDTYNHGTSSWNSASELKFLWLPRPDLYLKTDENPNNWRLYTGIKPTGNTTAELNTYAEETYCHKFYFGETIPDTSVKKGLTESRYYDSNVKSYTNQEGSSLYSNPSYFKVSKTNDDSELGTKGHTPTLGDNLTIGNFDQATSNIEFTRGTIDSDKETTGYYVYKFTLNIWIEGEDAEARRSMNEGMFNMELFFGN